MLPPVACVTLELCDPDIWEFVRYSRLPISCSGSIDTEFLNCQFLQLHVVDVLHFFLILDILGILNVFDHLFQNVLPECLHLSNDWQFLNLDGLLSKFPRESFSILPKDLVSLVLLTSFGKNVLVSVPWLVASVSAPSCRLSVVSFHYLLFL